MQWHVDMAKNSEATLQLNGVSIYSKYRPQEDASRWVDAEYDENVSSYVLIGLGLGYHLKALVKKSSDKPITVYCFEKKEYELFIKNNRELWWKKTNIHIVNDLSQTELYENIQILLPNVWLKAIGNGHPLFPILEVIKINQLSYKKNAEKMEANFYYNISLEDEVIRSEKQNKVACLVAAGPSLNETLSWLKLYKSSVDIYVVGAALKKLLANGIMPKATVLSDANDCTLSQFNDTDFEGELYYLCTANSKSVALHKGKRYILYQKGYKFAENESKKRSAPLVETGGSVGTTTFSLLEQLGYEQIVLFGQDLGFAGNQTHATLSTSGRDASNDIFLRKIEANDGSFINTTAMFHTFWFWYNKKMQNTSLKVFNTAKNGAKINNVPLINEKQFVELVQANLY